jgi:hypothetical protein
VSHVRRLGRVTSKRAPSTGYFPSRSEASCFT